MGSLLGDAVGVLVGMAVTVGLAVGLFVGLMGLPVGALEGVGVGLSVVSGVLITYRTIPSLMQDIITKTKLSVVVWFHSRKSSRMNAILTT